VNPFHRRFGFLSSPVLVTGTSLIALGILTLLLWSPWSTTAIASERPLRFYVAAGMTKPVQEIIRQYRDQFGVEVEATYDGTGKLLATIAVTDGQGDLFLAADSQHMRKAKAAGLVAETIPVAVIRPVLVVSPQTARMLRDVGKPITGLDDLLRDDLKVVLANPELASIGQLSREILEPLGYWKKLEKAMSERSARVSTVGTVNEVAGIVNTKDHYVGIVWDANADQFGLEKLTVPEFRNQFENLWIGVLKRSRQPTAALQFARYLTARDQGMEVFKKHRYHVMDDADEWAERPEITLSAGAMLLPAIADEIKRFGLREGVTINLDAGGCGLLNSKMIKMKSGQAPGKFPDAYFACDSTFLKRVGDWFEPGVTVSRNPMVMIVQKGNPRGITSLRDLTRPDLQIGLCDPDKSALGELTDRLLRDLGLRDEVYQGDWQKHILLVDAGHVLVTQLRIAKTLDVAVVYKSNAYATPGTLARDLDVIDIKMPGAVATQPFAVASESKHKYLVKRLLEALTSKASAAHFEQLGFEWKAGSK
jgi:molybdenum ABC transporter molybdate-binding protein